MEKVSFGLLVLLLLAAGCNSSTRQATPQDSASSKVGENQQQANSAPSLVVYENSNFGIKFQYNPNDYTGPVANKTEDEVWFSVTDAIEGTANGNIRISEISNKSASYIEDKIQGINKQPSFKDGGCSIKSTQRIAGQKALWYQCAGMGDPEIVIVEHPYKQVVLSIESAFPKNSFSSLISSLQFLNKN